MAHATVQFYRDRLDEFAGLLAHHFEEAGKLHDAALYSARAARWIGSTDPRPAIGHWRKVCRLLAEEPRSRENDILMIEANSQVAWLGWREGVTSDQARPFIQDALHRAREIDHSMISLLMFVEGRIAGASGGQADTYVRQVTHALSLTDKVHDAGRVATLNASLSQAYGWAGLLREAIAANDVALAGVPAISDFDHQFLGYSVEHWSLGLRGRLLVRLGRFDEARTCFDRVIEIKPEQVDPTMQFIAHLGYVDMAWCLSDAAVAKEHAARVAEMATRHGSPYLRVYSLACDATANTVAGDYDRAISAFTEGIQYLREVRVAMESEPEMLAALAECLLSSSRPLEAIDAASEAIDIAGQRNARLPECRASITLGRAMLLASGVEAGDGANALFDRAETLIQVSGACIYEWLLREARELLASVRRRESAAAQAM